MVVRAGADREERCMHAYVRVYVRECARGTTYSFGLNANHLVTNAEAGNVSRGPAELDDGIRARLRTTRDGPNGA